jgi:hypothetical protein
MAGSKGEQMSKTRTPRSDGKGAVAARATPKGEHTRVIQRRELLEASEVLALQSAAGNRAVAGAVQAKAATAAPATIQMGGKLSRATPVGRLAAVEYTSKFPVGTMGHLVHETVKQFAVVFGDVAAGEIGQHYRTREDVLARRVTKFLVIRFAIEETRWWQQQRGLPGFVGSWFRQHWRAGILLARARSLGILAPDNAATSGQREDQ